jgi:hypothetical protein
MSNFSKKCPSCSKEIKYTTKGALTLSIKRNCRCKSCVMKERVKDPNDGLGAKKGKENTFFGKKHSPEAINKIKQTKLKNKDSHLYYTKEYKEKMSFQNSGSKNPMYGKSLKSIWLKKYGEEETLKRIEAKRKKVSKAMSGKNNPQYGKAAPKKSGNGWNGWYKKFFFRSLRELSYVIKYLEKENLKWVTGESLRIPYLNYKKQRRTYSPDFIIEEKLIVEIKPIKLHNSPDVVSKKNAMIEYCESRNMEYKIIDWELISVEELDSLVLNGDVTLTDRTKKKLEEYKNKCIKIKLPQENYAFT